MFSKVIILLFVVLCLVCLIYFTISLIPLKRNSKKYEDLYRQADEIASNLDNNIKLILHKMISSKINGHYPKKYNHIQLTTAIIKFSKEYPNILKRVVGHELGHMKYNDYTPPGRINYAINIIKELRADLISLHISGLSIDEVIATFDYEDKFNKTKKKTKKYYYRYGYPTYEQRKYYISKYFRDNNIDGIKGMEALINKYLNEVVIDDLVGDYCDSIIKSGDNKKQKIINKVRYTFHSEP